jgi:hypothetical protein
MITYVAKDNFITRTDGIISIGKYLSRYCRDRREFILISEDDFRVDMDPDVDRADYEPS